MQLRTWLLSLLSLGLLAIGPLTRDDEPAPLDPMVIYPFSSTVVWNAAPPSAVVRATVGRDGRVAAEAEVQASIGGMAVVSLKAPEGDFYLQPADVLRLEPLTGSAVEIVIPDVRADMDVRTNRVEGRSPEGLTMTLTVDVKDPRTGAVVVRPVDAPPVRDGTRFSYALDGVTTVRPGDTARLTFRTDGIAFRLPVAALAAEIDVEQRVVAVTASLGTQVRLRLFGSDPSFGTNFLMTGGATGRSTTIPEGVGPLTGLQLQVGADSPVDGLDARELSAQVPVLGLWVDLDRDEVHGTAPPDSPLVVQVRDPSTTLESKPTASAGVRSDSTGAYTASFRPDHDLQGGWKVAVRLPLDEGLTLVARIVTRSVRVPLYGQTISAFLPDLTLPITMTLRSAAGTLKATGQAQVSRSQAEFQAARGMEVGGVQILPTDTLEIETSRGDPIFLTMPELEAHADAAKQELTGTAPPGSTLRLTVPDATGKRIHHFTTADDDGHYRFPQTEDLSFLPETSGSVAVISSRGDEFELSWVVPQLSLNLVSLQLGGIGPNGRDVTVEVQDPAGAVLIHRAQRMNAKPVAVYHRGQSWRMPLVDSAGQPLALRPGDVVRAWIGPDVTELVVPTIQVDFDVTADIIRGRTSLRRAAVSGHVWKAALFGGVEEGRPLATVQSTTDDAGLWQWDLAESGGLAGLDNVTIYLAAENGHFVVTRASARGFTVDMSSGDISGFVAPGQHVTATLRGPAALRGAGADLASNDGAFTLRVVDERGQPVLPTDGDEVIIATDRPTETMRAVLPRFEAHVSVADKAVTGLAVPGGLVSVSVAPTFRVGIELNNPNDGVATTGAEENGRYSFAFADIIRGDTQALAPSPGAEFKVRQQVEPGFFVQRRAYVPLINAEHGGSQVCGVASPHQRVDATLRSGTGEVLAQGSAQADARARYSIRLRDSAGRTRRLVPGQSVTIEVDGHEAKLALPPLNVTVDRGIVAPQYSAFPVDRISGATSPYVDYFVTVPLIDCFTGEVLGSQYDGRTASNGALSTYINPQSAGEGVELAFRMGTGQRFFRHLRRLQLEAHVGKPTLMLYGTVGNQVDVELRRGGEIAARADMILDDEGRGRLDFRTPAGAAVMIAAGDVIAAREEQSKALTTVVSLNVDGDAASGLFGSTAPDQCIVVQLRLRDGRTLAITTEASSMGDFALRETDLPPRRDWGLGDVTTFLVLAPDQDGHRTAVDGRLAAEPQDPRARPIFLPMLGPR